MSEERKERRGTLGTAIADTVSVGLNTMSEKMEELKHDAASEDLEISANFPMIRLPKGYEIEKVVDQLTYPTSVTWDDRGNMYIAEAGGTFLDEEGASARILRVEANGETTEVANLDGKIYPAISGMIWHNGAFYITHREMDLSGAVSRVTMDGQITRVIGGIIDSKSDHQPNDIRVGRDGKMYVCVGTGGNSGFMDENMIPFVLKAPDGRPTPAKDIVLRGVNIQLPDFVKGSGYVLTGAFVPFGTETYPGQIIKGHNKAGGTILVFDPENGEETVRPFAWGFRNIIGIAWNSEGELFASVNGYDNAPGRPINDTYDGTYRVREGEWYGWPDFTANFDPVTDAKYKPTASTVAPVFINGERHARELHFLIDHEASGLEQPDKSLILGLHEVNSSPSKPDVAPASWGKYADRLFVPEFGDMEWITNPTRDKPAGSRIVVLKTTGTGEHTLRPFVQNEQVGPGSTQGTPGQGIERPYDVKFGPDDAMYIVDFGSLRVNLNNIAKGKFPVQFDKGTGMLWRVRKISEE